MGSLHLCIYVDFWTYDVTHSILGVNIDLINYEPIQVIKKVPVPQSVPVSIIKFGYDRPRFLTQERELHGVTRSPDTSKNFRKKLTFILYKFRLPLENYFTKYSNQKIRYYRILFCQNYQKDIKVKE